MNGVSVVPHQNWRGMFALGTNPAGGRDVPDIDWPGFHTTPWHGATRVVENWFGSLSTGMRDASGQMYMRNRYYDPATGQFTQPDPIGLAGGLNAYGFAAGDPVTYNDPYGLSADTLFRDRASQRAVEEAAKKAPSLHNDLTVLANDPTVLVTFRNESMPGLNPGRVDPPFINAAGQREIAVTFDLDDVQRLQKIPAVRDGGGVTNDDVVGHEVHAHVMGFYRGDPAGCSDGSYGPQDCSIRAENRIRKEMGNAQRSF